MSELRASIDVDAPITTCFQEWSDFENFPEFMAHVRDVRRIGERETLWVARVMGKREEWRATTTAFEPNRRIAWQADGEVGMDGDVLFTSLGQDRTRIDVRMTWRGEGALHGIADALGIDQAVVERDLHRFQEYMEGRRTPVAHRAQSV